jgi:hypothetical protein
LHCYVVLFAMGYRRNVEGGRILVGETISRMAFRRTVIAMWVLSSLGLRGEAREALFKCALLETEMLKLQ